MNILRSYKLVATTALVALGGITFAQTNDPGSQFSAKQGVTDEWKPSLVRDGAYDRVEHPTHILEWQPLRENDVMWSKRVWREIDIREKQNMAFRYPGDDYTGGGYFIEIVLDAVKKGKIKAYSNVDERFTTTLTKEQIIEMMVGTADTTEVVNPETGEIQMVITRREFNPDLITKYRVKEEWLFDRNLGRMVVRILGVAPIKDIIDESTGLYRASQAMFWLYYPEMRPMLAQYEVFNPENDVARMTWYDFFEGRFFSSKIIKTSNPFDMNYTNRRMSPLEALYEGQKANEMLFNKEHDMWVY